MYFEFDIFDNCNLINNFVSSNDIIGNNYQDIFTDFFKKYYWPLYYHTNNNINFAICDFDSLKIKDIIDITYIPYSQKYLDYYNTKSTYGKIFFLDEKERNGLIYHDTIINNKYVRRINSIAKEFCNYYGNSPGYDLYIKKYTKYL